MGDISENEGALWGPFLLYDMIELQDDRYCFACGERNPIGLKLDFHWDGDVLSCLFTPLKEHQGYTDIIHGGIITTILDECMAQASIRKFGTMAATVEITVRFRKALMAGENVRVEARINDARHGVLEGTALMQRTSDNGLVASAEGRLMKSKK